MYIQQFTAQLQKYMTIADLSQLVDIDRLLVGSDPGRHTFMTLAVGFWALRQNNFRETIEAIILQGGSVLSILFDDIMP